MLKLDTKKLFIFDMDGLMIDSEIIYYQAWKQLLEADGYKLRFEFYKTMIGSPGHMLRDNFIAEFGDEFPFDYYLCQYKINGNAAMAREGVPIKSGLIQLLHVLTKNGLKKAVATSSSRADMEMLLKSSNLYQWFDYFLCGDEVRYGKPHPEIYRTMLALGRCRAADAVVLEDSSNGIKAATAAGIDCIFVKDIVLPNPDVLRLTYASLESLDEVLYML